MQNFEQIRSHLASGDFRITMQEPYVLCVELSLDQGRRHQAIFLSELEDDDGRTYLRVSTVIAPTTGIDCRRALAFNWESRVGPGVDVTLPVRARTRRPPAPGGSG